MSHHPALRSEPPLPWSARTLAGMLAIVVHVLFFVVLVLSVNWHSEDTAPVAVEMWSPSTLRASMAGAVPPTPLPPAPQPVVPQPAPTPPSPPQPAPQPEPPAPPQQELAPTPNPDIALAQARAKAKQEKAAQLADEARQQAQQEKLKKQQQEKLQQEKLQQEKQQQEKQLELKRQAAVKQAQLKQQRVAALQKMLAQQTQSEFRSQSASALTGVRQQLAAGQKASLNARLLAEYQNRIRSKIRSRIILPESLSGNPKAIFEVKVLSTGEVVDVQLVHSSGQSAYDDAVQRAIIKASPLPMPANTDLASQFRDLRLDFSPSDQK